MTRAALLLTIGLFACKPDDRKACEHGRDVLVAGQRAAMESLIGAEGLDTEQAKELRDEVAQVESAFVERCLALDAVGKACIARVDEIQAASKQMTADIARCDAEGESTTCKIDHIEKLEQRFADCMPAIDSLFDQRPEADGSAAKAADADDPQERLVVELEAAANEVCACKDIACFEAAQRRLEESVSAARGDAEMLGDAQRKRVEQATKKITECAMKLASSATPK